LHGDWKVIRLKKGAPQLFDLGQDSYEKTNLAADRGDKLKEMLALLDAQLARDDKAMPADLKGLPH
jgi:arylsulfatase A-like enzyme